MLTPTKTYGEGDCAFHAIFGKWTGDAYFCVTVLEKRKEFAAAYKQAVAFD